MVTLRRFLICSAVEKKQPESITKIIFGFISQAKCLARNLCESQESLACLLKTAIARGFVFVWACEQFLTNEINAQT